MRAVAFKAQRQPLDTSRHPTRCAKPLLVARAHGNNRFTDPYSTLGLEHGASEHDVKRAYRKLAKKFHPDVSKGNTELQFLQLAEAYAQLMSGLSSHNADGSTRPGNSEAFHDWYWSFRLRRTWESKRRARATAPQAAEAAAAGPADAPEPPPASNGVPPPGAGPASVQSAEGLRSQLAGLRHRAAIRKHRPATAASPVQAHQQQENAPTQEPVLAEGPSDSGEPMPGPCFSAAAGNNVVSASGAGAAPTPGSHTTAAPPRRKFAATDEQALKHQLQGMRRKAALKQQFSSA